MSFLLTLFPLVGLQSKNSRYISTIPDLGRDLCGLGLCFHFCLRKFHQMQFPTVKLVVSNLQIPRNIHFPRFFLNVHCLASLRHAHRRHRKGRQYLL